jgi:hypothetical protein
MRDILTTALNRSGIQVRQASNGVEAIEQIRKERPAAMFLDLMMPEMDGFTLLSKVDKDETLEVVPTIILSAVGELVREDSLPGVKRVMRKGLITKAMLIEALQEIGVYEQVANTADEE